MSAKTMYDLRENLCTNLDQYARKENFTRNDLDTVHLLTDTIKNIDKISAMEEEGNSYGMGRWDANGSYSSGTMDRNGYSGRRGRGSRDGGNYSGNNGNYPGNNYSGADAYDMEGRMRREMNY